MTALAQLVGHDQAARLARLKLDLAAAPPPPAELTSAVCRECGRPRPVPAAVFAPGDAQGQR